MDDSPERLRADILLRKAAQNERRIKAGKKPRHKLPKPGKGPCGPGKPPMPESGDIQDSAMSFDEWKAAGFSVRKGQKFDHLSIEGIPQFLMTQVQKTNPSWEKFRRK